MELHSLVKEPIHVYCHVKSVTNNASQICLNVKDKNTVVLYADRTKNIKDEHYSFTQVFDSKTPQKTLFDHIALPLIKDLLRGRNGVLFMHGILFNDEILVRCIEVIFNSIKSFQTPESVGEPNQIKRYKMYPSLNISDGYAKETDYRQETGSKRKTNQSIWLRQIQDSTAVEVCRHKRYSILISNVDIYKNYIYDLLENSANCQKFSKILQEDPAGHMYVSGAIEKQVRTAEEALSEFEKGQTNRNHLHATLKTESSPCSQTVFVIKVVHTRSNPKTEKTSQEKEKFSRLCIVYLESGRDVPQNLISYQNFQNTGHANKTVSVLQKCFEAYQESLNSGRKEIIPYQNSKLTQLFQSYFEGQGKIRMLIVINPDVKNYKNTVGAMNFAERRQDISSLCFSSVALLAKSKLQGQISMTRKEDYNKWEYITPIIREQIPSINIPCSSKNLKEEELNCNALEDSLNIKILRHKNLVRNLMDLQENFRKKLTIIENENIHFKQENIVLLQDLKGRESQIQTLERKIWLAEQTIENLNKQNFVIQQQAKKAKIELDQKIKRLIDQTNEIEEAKQKMHEKFAREKGKLKKMMDKRFAAKQTELKRKLCFTDEKLKQLREILNADDWDTFGNMNMFFVPSITSFGSSFSNVTQSNKKDSSENSVIYSNSLKFQSETGDQERKNQMEFNNINDCYSAKGIAASNSSCMGGVTKNISDERREFNSKELWIEQKPRENLQMNAALEPKIKKSVWRLKLNDWISRKVSKYILPHQEIDSQGEIETHINKEKKW